MSVIPTIGRVVHLYPNQPAADLRRVWCGLNITNHSQPLAAIVTSVRQENEDFILNLAVFDHKGKTANLVNVLFLPTGDSPQVGPYAQWPPRQEAVASADGTGPGLTGGKPPTTA